MKKKTRALVICAVLILLAALWIWRYVTMNAYYSALSGSRREVYEVGEIIPFGEDHIEVNTQANGYSIRVDKFEILDLADFLSGAPIPAEQVHTNPDKVAVVYITLFNDHSTAPGIMLTDLDLHGVDNYANIDWELLAAANPVLQGNYGISLSPETEYSVVLPFALYEQYFGADTWKNVNHYTWFLHITAYPTEKDIQVN